MYLLIVFLSLIGSCLARLFGRYLGPMGFSFVSILCLTFSLLISFFAFYEVVIIGCFVYIKLVSWISSDFIYVDWGFMFDNLIILMSLLNPFPPTPPKRTPLEIKKDLVKERAGSSFQETTVKEFMLKWINFFKKGLAHPQAVDLTLIIVTLYTFIRRAPLLISMAVLGVAAVHIVAACVAVYVFPVVPVEVMDSYRTIYGFVRDMSAPTTYGYVKDLYNFYAAWTLESARYDLSLIFEDPEPYLAAIEKDLALDSFEKIDLLVEVADYLEAKWGGGLQLFTNPEEAVRFIEEELRSQASVDGTLEKGKPAYFIEIVNQHEAARDANPELESPSPMGNQDQTTKKWFTWGELAFVLFMVACNACWPGK